jgi:hypothetical protein
MRRHSASLVASDRATYSASCVLNKAVAGNFHLKKKQSRETSIQKNMDTIMHPTCIAILGNASDLHCNARNASLRTACARALLMWTKSHVFISPACT